MNGWLLVARNPTDVLRTRSPTRGGSKLLFKEVWHMGMSGRWWKSIATPHYTGRVIQRP
jgi:hypothetical protein